MLDDRTRTEAFIDSIAAVVRPGDVVVDVGTGTGVLAVAAARAGARRVYAIEGSAVAATARELIERNNVSDRVTLIRKWSWNVTLPERGDVLVAEIVGHDPLAEGILETVSDASIRLMKPQALFIPRGVRFWCLAVSIPAIDRDELVISSRAAERWGRWYGIDFSTLGGVGTGDFIQFHRSERTRNWKPLGPPALLAYYDLAVSPRRPARDAVSTIRIATSGRLDAVLFYFELDADGQHGKDGLFFSTAPTAVTDTNHWLTPVRAVERSVAVHKGDTLGVRYQFETPRGSPRCLLSLPD